MPNHRLSEHDGPPGSTHVYCSSEKKGCDVRVIGDPNYCPLCGSELEVN